MLSVHMSSKTIAGRELMLHRDEARLAGPTKEIRFPAEPGLWKLYRDRVLVPLRMDEDGAADPTFEVDDQTRDLVAVTPDCDIDWIVEATPSALTEENRHRTVEFLSGRVLTKPLSKTHFFEVDGDTGEVVDHWPNTEFVVDGQRYEFDSAVTDFRSFEDRTLLNTAEGRIYGFDSDGNLLWEFDDGHKWLLAPGDDRFHLYFTEGGRIPYSKMKFEFDTERGEIVRSVNAPDMIVEKVLGDEE